MFVVPFVTTPVAVFLIDTLALGITAPLESVIAPDECRPRYLRINSDGDDKAERQNCEQGKSDRITLTKFPIHQTPPKISSRPLRVKLS